MERKFNFEKVYFSIFFIIFLIIVLRKVFDPLSNFIFEVDIYLPIIGSAILAYIATFIVKFFVRNYRGKAELTKITYNKLAIIGYIVSLPLQFLAFFIIFASYLGPWIYTALLAIVLLIPLTALWQIRKTGNGGKLFTIMSIVIILLAGYTMSFPLLKENFSKPVAVDRETVMTEGMTITAHTSSGTLMIKAGKEFERTYTWDNCTRTLTMWPREERWYGSYGIYYPGPGNHWQNCNGITRAVVEEGQQRFDNLEQAVSFLNNREKGSVYTNDGLVVLWGLVPERNQINAEVWQILINGIKPTQLPEAQNSLISVSF